MSYAVLELDSIPREKGALQAKINEARYQQRRARRRRMLTLVLLALATIGALVYVYLYGVPQLTIYQVVELAAGAVFVASLPRAIRSVRRERVAAPVVQAVAEGSQF